MRVREGRQSYTDRNFEVSERARVRLLRVRVVSGFRARDWRASSRNTNMHACRRKCGRINEQQSKAPDANTPRTILRWRQRTVRAARCRSDQGHPRSRPPGAACLMAT